MEVTQKTWQTAADWQKNGNETAPAQKSAADDVSLFGTGMQDIEPAVIEDITFEDVKTAADVKKADAPAVKAPEDNEALIKNLNEVMAGRNISLTAASIPKGNKGRRAQKDMPLMSETNKQILSKDVLKQLAGAGSLENKKVIENLKTIKNHMLNEAFNGMKSAVGIEGDYTPVSVTPSCSDCGRGWAVQKGCAYSNKNEELGGFDDAKHKEVKYIKDSSNPEDRNHKMYLLRMSGKYSNPTIRYTKDGKNEPGMQYGNSIINYCSRNQVYLGTLYNVQEALEELSRKK